METTNDAWVQAAAQGDQQAFGRLVRHHQGTVCAITLAITGELATAEDVAQDVFVAAWKGLHQLRNPASFGPWLRQLTRNRSHDVLRRAARRRTRVTPDDAAVAAAVDAAPDAVGRLENAEEQALLEEAISALSDGEREVLLLYYREGRSVKQVARLLDLTESAVKKRLSRARQGLREDVESRLDGTLRRSAPGTAFGVAVLAAIAALPPPAQARPLRSVGIGVGTAVLLMGGLAWWNLQPEAPAPDPSVAAVGPADVQRRAPRDYVTEPPVDAEPTSTLEVVVPLSDSGRLARSYRLVPGFDAWRWFPAPEDAPLPALESARTLQALLDEEALGHWRSYEHDRLTDTFLETATMELLPLDAVDGDPWEVLVMLEAFRRHDARRWREEAEQWGPVEQYIPERAWPDRRLDHMGHTALTLADAHGGTVVEDYALLYALHAAATSDEPVRGASLTWAQQVLEQTDDDRVALGVATALPSLLMTAERHLTGEELAPLRDVVPRLEDPETLQAVALTLLEQAVAAGARDDVRFWLHTAEEAHRTGCPTRSPRCDKEAAELDVIAAQLAPERTTPRSWRQALAQAVWACHRDTPIDLPQRWTGHWQEGWTFDDEAPAAACIARRTPSSPAPPPDVAIVLDLLDG